MESLEPIYIVSTAALAKRGVFYVGMYPEIRMFANYAAPSSAVCKGAVLRTYWVKCRQSAEWFIWDHLESLRWNGNDGLFIIPLKLLEEVVAAFLDEDDTRVYAAVEAAELLNGKAPSNWMDGIEPDSFRKQSIADIESFQLLDGDQVLMTFDLGTMPPSTRRSFVDECLEVIVKTQHAAHLAAHLHR